MIQSTDIKFFQSIEEAHLEFVPGVNVIIGKSDAGKSAIFRAIYWNITNRPLGDAFRTEWTDENTDVTITTTDKNRVRRVKGKSENSYEVNGLKLKAFGQNAPEEVGQVLNMDEVNIQVQAAPPFLLSNSPGEVAQILNRAAAIDDIDTSISYLNKALLNTKRDIQTGEEQLKEQKQKLEEYSNLPEIEEKVADLENLEKHRIVLQRQKVHLTDIANTLDEIDVEIEKLPQTEDAEIKIKEIEKLLGEWEEKKKASKELEQIQYELLMIEERAISLDSRIRILWEEFDKIAPETCPLCGGEME